MLVGRDAVLADLGMLLDAAIAGRGQLVVLSGEPGIGKSSIAEAIAARAAAAGARCCHGRAWELGECPPYVPLRAGLRDLGIDPDADTGFALWERVLDELARASATAPRVWIVEDVHVADLGSLDLLAFLARPVRGLPVLIIVTRRDRDPRLTDTAEQRLVRMARDGRLIGLTRLDPAGVAAVAVHTAGRPLSPAVCARLVELTGGNPLFVVECVRNLGAGDGSALPDTLRQVVQERIALLPEPTRDALVAAAVLGRETSAAMIGRVLELLPARVIDLLAPAIRAGIVGETAPGEFAFSHVIVRDAIEDSTSEVRRSELHHRAAVALGVVPATPAVVVERARHTLDSLDRSAADGVPIVDEAIRYLVERRAHDRAFALASRLDRARRAGQVPPGTPRDRLRVAELAIAAGRGADARAVCDDVIADARGRSDAIDLAEAVLVLASRLRPAVADPELIRLLEEARDALGSRIPALACRLDARLAAARQPAPDPREPVALAEAAIAQARALGDPALLLEVLDQAWSALITYVPMARRLEVGDEVIELARSLADRPRRLRAHTRRAMDLIERGDVAAFSREVDELYELSVELVEPRYRWRPLLMVSMRALAEGRAQDSERAIVEAEQLQALTDDPALRLSLFAHTNERALLLHQLEVLRGTVGTLEATIGTVTNAPIIASALRAQIHARVGDRAATAIELARLEPSFERAIDAGFRDELVEAYALAGTDAQLRRLRARFPAGMTSDLPCGHIDVSYKGPTARMTGLLDAALGDTAAGAAALRSALALAESRGHRLWAAQIGYELGTLLDDGALLARAEALATDVGMPGLIARIAAARHVAPVDRTRAAQVPPVGLRREGDVWRVDGGRAAVRIKDGRGVQLLARLIERPGEEIHVLALASDDPAAAAHDRAEAVIDPRARREYQRRLAELGDALDEAEHRGDEARYAALERERAQLAAEIARSVGLGGATRRAGSISERARINVQRRIKDAIGRVAEVDPDLGRYLDGAVRTGTYCCYRP